MVRKLVHSGKHPLAQMLTVRGTGQRQSLGFEPRVVRGIFVNAFVYYGASKVWRTSSW